MQAVVTHWALVRRPQPTLAYPFSGPTAPLGEGDFTPRGRRKRMVGHDPEAGRRGARKAPWVAGAVLLLLPATVTAEDSGETDAVFGLDTKRCELAISTGRRVR